MKRLVLPSILYLICSILTAAPTNVEQIDVDHVNAALSDANASNRAKALQIFNDKIAQAMSIDRSTARTKGAVTNEVIPPLVRALQDSDPVVRDKAAIGIARIAVSTARVKYPVSPGKPDLASSTALKAGLLTAMSDSDVHVRENAIRSYALSFPLTPEVEQKIITQFSVEQSQTVKELILDAIAVSGSPSRTATQFLIKELEDPKLQFVVAKTIYLHLKSPPLEALPVLATKLSSAQEPAMRGMLAKALAVYGAQAQPYLQELERIRDSERDETTKENLQAAANAIRSGRPLER